MFLKIEDGKKCLILAIIPKPLASLDWYGEYELSN